LEILLAQVKLFGNLRQYFQKRQLTINGRTVRDILAELCAESPAFCTAVTDDDGLRPFIKITVNGRDIQLENGLDTAVTNKDTIAIFPPIAGG